MFCDYGCGKEFKFQFKNGRKCCSNNISKCLKVIETIRKKVTGKNKGLLSGEKNPSKRLEVKKKISYKLKGTLKSDNHRKRLSESNKGKHPRSETLEKRSESMKRWWKEHPEKREEQRNFMKRSWSNYMNSFNNTEELRTKRSQTMLEKWKDQRSKYNSKEYKQTKKKQLESGQGAWMHSLKKNPSKPQLEIFKMVQRICPYVELNFPVFLEKNYSIDVAVPKLNLAIEYDGFYWHQDKKYEEERTRKLQEDGWIILKYKGRKGRDIIPDIEKLKRDIKKVLSYETY